MPFGGYVGIFNALKICVCLLSLCVCQESSVQEEVEMMVESLLDVLLQTLLSIMSKTHSVETSRGQRCPQCTAEITVRLHLGTYSHLASLTIKIRDWKEQVGFSFFFWVDWPLTCIYVHLFCLPAQGEYVSCLLSLLRQMTEIHFHHLLNNFHSKEELKVGKCLWVTDLNKSNLFHWGLFTIYIHCEYVTLQEFLLKIFCVFRNLMKLTIFPRDWSVMRLLTSQ